MRADKFLGRSLASTTLQPLRYDVIVLIVGIKVIVRTYLAVRQYTFCHSQDRQTHVTFIHKQKHSEVLQWLLQFVPIQ